MTDTYVKCIDDRRAQGTLVRGTSYLWLGSRRHVSKDNVERLEYRIVNEQGNTKWYDAARFENVGIEEPVKTVSQVGTKRTVEYEVHGTQTGRTSPARTTVKEGASSMAVKTAKKMTLGNFLASQGVPESMIQDLNEYRKEHDVDAAAMNRVVKKPSALYVGGLVWTLGISAILEGRNILLEGEKATGKNVFAENLAFAFGRPLWDISMHVNIDSSALIGSETFRDGQVTFRPGSAYDVAMYGGYGVLDEINMAKNEAVSALHAILDDRGVIDVPGYNRIKLHDCSRFIATMNYGYVGTRELNEALVSRFVVIHVPQLDQQGIVGLLKTKYPDVSNNVEYFAKLFTDLQAKAKNGEISTRTVDLRGIIDAIGLVDRGVSPLAATVACVVNKAFDTFERTKVLDVVDTLIPGTWGRNNLFGPVNNDEVTVDFSTVKGR